MLLKARRRTARIVNEGGSPETLGALQTRLCDDHLGFRIAGAESPPFRALSEDENEAACERINLSGARIL